METELRDRLQHLAGASADAAAPVVRDARVDEEQTQATAAVALTERSNRVGGEDTRNRKPRLGPPRSLPAHGPDRSSGRDVPRL